MTDGQRRRYLIGIEAEPDWGNHQEIELTDTEAMAVAKVAALFLPEGRTAYEVAPEDVDPDAHRPRPSEHPYLWLRIKPDQEAEDEGMRKLQAQHDEFVEGLGARLDVEAGLREVLGEQ